MANRPYLQGKRNGMATSPMKRSPWGEKAKARDNAEARFQAQVEELAQLTGWYSWHVYNARYSKAGMPDLILIRERVVWAELKATSLLTGRRGKTSAVQEMWLQMLRDAGQEVYLWWDDSDDWEEIKRVLSPVGRPLQ